MLNTFTVTETYHILMVLMCLCFLLCQHFSVFTPGLSYTYILQTDGILLIECQNTSRVGKKHNKKNEEYPNPVAKHSIKQGNLLRMTLAAVDGHRSIRFVDILIVNKVGLDVIAPTTGPLKCANSVNGFLYLSLTDGPCVNM